MSVRPSSKRKRKSMFESKYLPLELWQEISARLPIKALMRIRCVCKAWCSMIDSPNFARMHYEIYNQSNGRTKNPTNGSLLCVAEPRVLLRYGPCKFTLRHGNTFKKIDDLCEISISDKEVVLLGSCNGLWLIEHNSCNDVQIRVWNPCTRKSFRLHNDPFALPRVSNYVIGFVPSTNEYKVVRFMHSLRGSNVSISIFSLSTNRWRTKTNTVDVPNFELSQDLRIQDVVFVKNASYWLELCPKTKERTYLVSFDFDAEELSFFKLPVAEEKTIMLANKFIFNLNDSIAVLSISSSTTRVWILDKNNDNVHQWRLWLSTNTHANAINLIEDPQNLPHTSIFYQHNTGTFLIAAAWRKLISYNISNHQVQYLRERGFFGFIDTYVENLVSHANPKWENCDIVSSTKARKTNTQKRVLEE